MANITKRIIQAKRDGMFIQTARLFLLPLDVCDAPDAFRWCGDPEVTKFLRYTTYANVSDVAKWIAQEGHNVLGFFLRESGQLIGSGSVQPDEKGVCEMGYNLARSYWGKGYCTEASKGMLSWRVAQGSADFVCGHAIDNPRSGRVIQKCGFTNPTEWSYTSFDGTRTFSAYEYTLHIDRHEMNVDKQWFDKIANGSKTIELRLNDDKRRKIKIGDYIVLNNLDENADLTKCVVQVTALHVFTDFKSLYASLDMTKCGYSITDTPDSDDMLAYYSTKRQSEWGVVGIEFDIRATF